MLIIEKCNLLSFEMMVISVGKPWSISYIKDNPSASFRTQRHNCDVRKESYQLNHTILKISLQLCDLIGH